MVSIFLTTPQNTEQKTDAIIVLTGGEKRIESGLELFVNEMAPDLFITGVYPSVKKRDIVKKWTQDRPLPVCCITLGYEATTTVQNATETEKWLHEKNYKSIRLVTANFHMNRALIEFKHLMPDLEIIMHPIQQPNATPAEPWFWIVSLSEYNKTLIRWAGLILYPPMGKHKGSH